MKETAILTLKELLSLVGEYSEKGLYFRGENKDNGKTSCLPQRLRCPLGYHSDEKSLEWFTGILESLSVGTPYHPLKGETTTDNILEALLNTSDWSWLLWDEEKLDALITHYSPDFTSLDNEIKKQNLISENNPFKSSFLDITSDIMTALHFACSQFKFLPKNEAEKLQKQETKECVDGYLFVFDLTEIEKDHYLKLVSHQSYSYFYKKDNKLCYQPFDRITHQRGAFLSPKRDKKRCIEYVIFETELKKHICDRITISASVKQELYQLFGSSEGLNYYFPKIPFDYSETNNIQKIYDDLHGITFLE